jgi:hypothetical protein
VPSTRVLAGQTGSAFRALAGFVGLVIVLFAAACDSGSTIATSKLSQLVLTEQDMPGFASFSKGPQVRLDNQGTVRSDASRYGREGGWIIRLHPADSASTAGPLVVESRADLFKTSDGAKSDIAAYRVLFSRLSGEHKEIVVSGLGQDAVGVTFTQPGGRTLRFFRIAWRSQNATASITVEGFDGQVSQNDALALAHKQEKRIEGA